MPIALLYPGQGAQTPGFLHALPQYPATKAVLEQASATLAFDVLTLDTPAELQSAVSTQLALLTAATAFTRYLETENVPIAAAAGMSLGAFSAAVAARSLTFPDALRAVRLRAQLMQRTLPPDYRMALIEGLRESTLGPMLEDTTLTLANRNSPVQFVVAGPTPALESLIDSARQAGAHTARILVMPTASHTPLLAPAATELFDFLQSVPVAPPAFPLFSNRTARPVLTAHALRHDLAENMAHPVRWHDSVTALLGHAPTLLLEAPPGHTLTHLAASFHPDIPALAAADHSWPTLLRRAQSKT